MPTSLTETQHLEALAHAAGRLADEARAAGRDTPVPTCPGWSVADLVAHQGHVHRWAAANLRGESTSAFSGTSTAESSRDDLLEWFADGLDELASAFGEAPIDVKAIRFLKDAPAPRAFWARRQAHETTMHSVDALAARLGRTPTASEAGIDADLAVDGIDELLCGFMPRGSSRMRSDTPLVVGVAPDDSDETWTVAISRDTPVTKPGGALADADAVLRGSAAQLYLGMWNRGDEIAEELHHDQAPEGTDVLATWRRLQRVRWS